MKCIWHVIDDGESESKADPEAVEDVVEEDEKSALDPWVMRAIVVGVSRRYHRRAEAQQDQLRQLTVEWAPRDQVHV